MQETSILKYSNLFTDWTKLRRNLYKYKSIPPESDGRKREELSELIRDSKIYFCPPKQFNDPYDCKVFPDLHIYPIKEIRKSLISKFAQVDNYNIKIIDKLLKGIFIQNNRIEVRNQFYIEMEKMINADYGIFSLTEDKTAFSMWAHYGNNHTGLCLQYNTVRLGNHLLDLTTNDQLFYLKKVRYVSAYPKIMPSRYRRTSSKYDEIKQMFIFSTIYKAKSWEKENEWRIIFIHPNCEEFHRRVKFNNNILSGIYFGAKTNAKDIDFVVNLIKDHNPKPKLYKMELVPYSFKLKANRIY